MKFHTFSLISRKVWDPLSLINLNLKKGWIAMVPNWEGFMIAAKAFGEDGILKSIAFSQYNDL